MGQYTLYPVKGRAARNYLLSLGYSVATERLVIPDHLGVTPTHDGVTYAVMREGETVFCIQSYPSSRWRGVVPVSYRISFSQLMKSYNIDESKALGIIGSHGAVFQLMRGIAVSRSLAVTALERLSDYTGHPYD